MGVCVMTQDVAPQSHADTVELGRSRLAGAGALIVAGMLVNAGSTLAHPAGDEDNHRAIFAEYADSDAWVTVHLGQFVGILLALAGLLVLSRAMRDAGRPVLLAQLAAAATVATAAVWAVLQGLDGVGLKEAADAWVASSGAEKSVRFANAEIVRWLEWGFQSYFRVLLGLSFVLFGVAILLGRLVARWLGWVALLVGALSAAIGIDVGYHGLASSFQDATGMLLLIAALAFALGVLITGLRGSRQRRH